VLTRLGFTLWDDALLTRRPWGEFAILDGLYEFREHLGGDLHVTLLRGIGEGFEVSDIDERLMVESIAWLRAWDRAGATTARPDRRDTRGSGPTILPTQEDAS